ncbi:Phosphatidylserine decarboxylase proenzyme, putative [Pediculus humanus corporis]|uniref:phosphatidylserine decarboxylase n=1 Tax=Pediculus humanus subsp. corporis TaxID=121224 RepID=E0VL75_PEDHC|nr:Phosphatidylserine decarboxylase proenzyme, putative [Pediculus humanus corporis]EEB14131.1 Phosphatidylserine decarboxylase proenzyme, putative [Pediculus humanus corporis]
MSRLWGAITNIDLPVFIRPKIYSLYASSFGVNLDECEVQDLTRYKSLSEFFIRPLREECRPIDSDHRCIVSPADGRVLTFGKITSCQVDQVKGVTYSLQQFLGKQSWRKMTNRSTQTTFEGLNNERQDTDLYQCVVYLAPGDYHRFHSPVSWKVKFRRHFQGKLLSVNPAVASWINNLFSLNERAVYVGSWEHGFFSLTAVGATNVGFIRVVFDPVKRDLFFAQKDWRRGNGEEAERKVRFDKPVEIQKGQLFGEFRLGSTIVLIFEAPKNFKFDIENGQKIKYGEKIGAYTTC